MPDVEPLFAKIDMVRQYDALNKAIKVLLDYAPLVEGPPSPPPQPLPEEEGGRSSEASGAPPPEPPPDPPR